jgi:hypothetical protein
MAIINFAIIIDGEVAGNVTYPADFPGASKLEAIYSSAPTFVRTEERIGEGSTWDGTTFAPPA